MTVAPNHDGTGPTQVIVLNGGSSSGKTAIVQSLQRILPRPWLHLGVDELVQALPPSLLDTPGGIEFGSAGEVTPGQEFHALETAWLTGLAAMARAGAHVIIDDVFLSGATSQERVRRALTGLSVLWVGVRCDPSVAAARERSRGDRAVGMAAGQADLVHSAVRYDLEVDTSRRTALTCAEEIAGQLIE